MKIAVLSASPKQQLSLTLQTVRALEKMYKEDEFDISFIKDVNDCSAFQEKANSADLILVLSSLYHFNVHGQLIAYLKNIQLKEGTPITYITTSGCNMDVPAHNYMRSFARHAKLKWIRSLSLLDEDILKETGREELYRWFQYVKDVVNDKKLDDSSLKDLKVTILDAGEDEAETKETVDKLVSKYSALGANVRTIVLREKSIKGCIACFGCYTNNTCVIKDDFMELSKDIDENTDLLVTVSSVSCNQFSSKYKYFLDRHVTYGRFSQDLEMRKAYMVCGGIEPMDYVELEQHTLVMDSLSSDLHIGIYQNDADGIEKMVNESAYACINDLYPQRNTYFYGLSMQFANLAYRLQNMTPNDYNYFKSKGYYDTPAIIPNVRPISGIEEGRMSCQMRLIAFEEMLANLDGAPKLTKRGERTKNKTIQGVSVHAEGEEAPKKGGFLGLFGKK